MSLELKLRPALGTAASLGALYDARKDRFLSQSIFSDNVPGEAIQVQANAANQCELTLNDSLKERLSKLGLDGELSASYLTDLVSVSGSSKYLSLFRTSSRILQASAICSTLTKHHSLVLENEELNSIVDADSLQTDEATHVVCGIQWGARSIVTIRSHGDTLEVDDVDNQNSESTQALETVLKSIKGAYIDQEFEVRDDLKDMASSLKFRLNVDVPTGGALPTSYEGVCQYIRKVPDAMKKVAAGKGKPLFYELIPIQEIARLLQQEAPADITYDPLDEDNSKQILGLFETFEATQQSLQDYAEMLQRHSFCVPANQLQVAQAGIKAAEDAELALKPTLSTKVFKVRSGNGASSDIDETISVFTDSNQGPTHLLSITSLYADKMVFADEVKANGAAYLSDDPEEFMPLLQKTSSQAYVLHYSEATMKSPDWQANHDKILSLVQSQTGYTVIILDHDLGEQRPIQKPHIELWEEGQARIADFVADAEELSGKSLLKCKEENLIDSSLPVVALSKRMSIEIACPSKTCTSMEEFSWTCPDCKDIVYYYPKDSNMYCSCGGFRYSDAVFKCQNPNHGLDFAPAQNSNKLLTSLKACKPTKQYNILILGETGVGKSTFINSFINYILYDSLDEAMAAPGLKYAIPCSFSYEELIGNEFLRHTVKVGNENDFEKDSKGGISATQNTVTYEFLVDGKIIRLIDTPGIGDTRGLNQDHKNVKDILDTLESVDKLNTILFLMKPNSARLTTTFDFCLTELLSHLHKDTNKNIVFGFTNSRSTNYMLGDTREPLETLLQKRNTGIKLGLPTLYFFDSESFRYLAAYKQLCKEMPGKDSFVASWEKSSEEARRLIETTFVLPTHEVKMTLNLNRTRTFITGMAKPMLEFSKNLQDNEKKFKAKIDEIEAFKNDNTKLRSMLVITKTVLERRPLSKPRTVCGDSNCLKFEDDPDDPTSSKKTTVYKSICHEECYIDTPQEVQGYPELSKCSAFNTRGTDCVECGHGWKQHLHISYDLIKRQVKMDNAAAIEAMLKNDNAKEAAEVLKAKLYVEVKELQAEDALIKQALAKFGVYLKNSAMVAYNDTTIAYLDYMIQQAKNSSMVVNQLEYENLKAAYENQKNEIEEAIKAGGQNAPTEAEIDQIIKSIKSLKHSKDALASLLPDGTISPAEHRSVTVDLRSKRSGAKPKAGGSGSWFSFSPFSRRK